MEKNKINYNKVLVPPTGTLIEEIGFGVALKTLPTEGNMAYEYNPFRNYRITKTSYKYNNKLLSPRELLKELGVSVDNYTDDECREYLESRKSWKDDFKIPDSKEDPELYEAGELVDFETDELAFDINHPVSILPQYSYDGSVNLILNDGKNQPRLINSRFSALGKNKYQIVDRKGNNDTNIYDQGSQFDIDTSLYKRVVEIPRLKFVGVGSGGRLGIGNYHFYFRYTDADGNETDFVAESGLVSIFIGNDPASARTGWREEDSHKSVQFILSNVDSAYQYVSVYYTKTTADIFENSNVIARRIDQKFLVDNDLKCSIVITGYEDVTDITLSDINPAYQVADSVYAQEQCQNMLFLGNISNPTVPYQELTDLSLRFLPQLNSEDYPLTMDQDYNITSSSKGYYDPKFIYNKVGYWNHEIYRFGIVYIMSNNTLSHVYNIRGVDGLSQNTKYSSIPMYNEDGERNYIITEEDTYRIVTEATSYSGTVSIDVSNHELENAKGVVSLAADKNGVNAQQIYSIQIKVDKEVIDYLKNTLKIKGFFFVRQKRMPTTLCQAYMIGIDKESKTPVLPTSYDNKNYGYTAERFLDDNRILNQNFEDRLYTIKDSIKVRTQGAICPDYDVDYPYFNSLFTGDKFVLQESDFQSANNFLTRDGRNFYTSGGVSISSNDDYYTVKVIGVEDNTKLVAINDLMFSGRAGEAEEAYRYEYIAKENKITEANNLLRGCYGPFLGITGYSKAARLVDIKITGFDGILTEDLFKIRYNDKASFYAISDRIDINSVTDWFSLREESYQLNNPLYRGDCYICQYTHRINRNFQDPSAPINDKVVDKNCWKDHYEIEDDVLKVENFTDINLGDVNAIKLGMWITFTLRSSRNLNIRSIDESMTDEEALTGHPRGFFPYHPISAEGSYKVPEGLCYNKGFESSVSERYNFEMPDVPAIKNDFTNRICYSDIHINDAFKNGYRVFQNSHYRDYPKTYGQITKLVELRGNLLCVFEHGVALISVNERAIAGEGSSGLIYINTSNVLPENPKIISDTYGSQWKDSIIKTDVAVYGVDTIGKKIWRTNGSTFECISDFYVQEYLNNNISLGEREIDPIMGIRNVKTHYNKFKQDVMFTFYDNLQGFEETVWNLCYNETMGKWVTFYSWVPSFSENIYNQFFSFDRNTSKWISKLGISRAGSDFAEGVVLSNNVINNNAQSGDEIGTLSLEKRTISEGSKVVYVLERDNFQNYNKFEIRKYETKDEVSGEVIETGYKLYLKVPAIDLCSEFYERKVGDIKIENPKGQVEVWKNGILNDSCKICKNSKTGAREWLNSDLQINPSTVVYLLNIRAYIVDSNIDDSLVEETSEGGSGNYYESVVAVIPKYNMQFLSSDFWKHGSSGIIDVADKINPCNWYGKQHPFEIEFVVVDNPNTHKIFDNLEILSNNAEPESFHYEIIGDCYDFAKDKENMYIRQEATKEFYQYNGSDIRYDDDYINLTAVHRPLYEGAEIYDKSTLFPLYYSRCDTVNEIEDEYKRKTSPNQDYSALAGAEIVKYDHLDEYRIWNHAEAVNISNPKKGRLRGNMQYKEDKWYVQINPITLYQKNEPKWGTEDITGASGLEDIIPIEIGNSPIPGEVKESIVRDGTNIPKNSTNRAIVTWKWQTDNQNQRKEVKMKDKWIKIKIRYSGDKLAIISAINTLFSISYS